MALGRRREERQEAWVATTDLPKSPGHVFYGKLNELLHEADFDRTVEELCEPRGVKIVRRRQNAVKYKVFVTHTIRSSAEIAGQSPPAQPSQSISLERESPESFTDSPSEGLVRDGSGSSLRISTTIETRMSFILQPWQLLLLILSGWVNREQQRIIEYQRTEIEVLKELFGKKRILLNDNQRRRLGIKGKVLGRNLLRQFGTLFAPDTILRWHRTLVAKKWSYVSKRIGRPRIRQIIVDFILRFAKENVTWGCDRIQGELAKVGYKISDTTVENVLKKHGIEPAPNRQRTGSWAMFLKAHWDVLAAIDFTTVEVWTTSGLITFYLLFVMELKTRRVHFAGCTVSPNEVWMKQAARELTNCEDGFLNGKKCLIMDGDTKFCESFRSFLDDEGVEPVVLPPRVPNMNAHLERFMLSLKSECLGKLILFGESSLRNAVGQYLAHYHFDRPHQGLGNELITPFVAAPDTDAEVECSERLGGLLRSYRRAA